MSADAIAAVLAELDREEAFLFDLTQQLVRIPTVNPKFEANIKLNHEADLQHFLRMVLDGFSMRCETYDVFPGRPNLIATLPGDAERSLILCGHVDVVPVGDRRKWNVEPFGGEIRERRLYGRGALDMKSGLAAAVAVARALTRAGVTLQGRLDLHAVVDEEAGGFGARDIVERGRHAAGLIVMEPTWQALMPAEGGLEWVRVTFRGRNAHSAWRYNEIFPQANTPGRLEPGVNALEIAVRFVTAVQQLERDWTTRKPAHPLLPPGVNTIHPGVMVCGSGIGANGLPALLSNPAIIPDVAVIDFDLKFLPNETSQEIRREFEAFVDAFARQDSWLRAHPPSVQWDLYGLHFPPLNTPVGHDLVHGIVEARAAQGQDTEIKGFTAVCDAAHYAGVGIPGVIFGPGGDGLHGPDEYVDLDSLAAVAKTLAAAAVRWCGVRGADA
jgi:acetylornithine deacetylase